MEKFVSHEENSRIGWGVNAEDGKNPDRDDIKLGCLQRIADATEAMAKEHTRLIRDRDYYEREFKRRGEAIQQLERRNAALRGVVTKLKKAKLQSGMDAA